MRAGRFIAGIGDFFDSMGSAIAVSRAMREHRPAPEADLKRLGIDPAQFQRIRLL